MEGTSNVRVPERTQRLFEADVCALTETSHSLHKCIPFYELAQVSAHPFVAIGHWQPSAADVAALITST